MKQITDILFDETGDLAVSGGDLLTGDATMQHQADLLSAFEGEYKQFPTTGVGLSNFLNDEDTREMGRKIRMQFDRDGIQINTMTVTGGLVNIKAIYR